MRSTAAAIWVLIVAAAPVFAQAPTPPAAPVPIPADAPRKRFDDAFDAAGHMAASDAIVRHATRRAAEDPAPALAYAAPGPAVAVPVPEAAPLADLPPLADPGGPPTTAAVPVPRARPEHAAPAPPAVAEAAPAPTDETLAEPDTLVDIPTPRDRPNPTRRTQVAAVAVPSQARAPVAPLAEGRACTAALKAAKVEFTPVPAIAEGQCGAEAPLSVTKVAGITLQPAATMTCPMAAATADWVLNGLVPAGRKLGGQPSTIMVAASYDCRGRRTGRAGPQRLSEHGKANALDVRAIKFADGREVAVQPKGGRSAALDAFQAEIRAAGCTSFKTILGPGQPMHADHLHFDLAERRRGGVVCR